MKGQERIGVDVDIYGIYYFYVDVKLNILSYCIKYILSKKIK